MYKATHSTMHSYLNFSTLFLSTPKYLYRGEGWEMVGSHEVMGYSKAQQFSRLNGLA